MRRQWVANAQGKGEHAHYRGVPLLGRREVVGSGEDIAHGSLPPKYFQSAANEALARVKSARNVSLHAS